MALDGVVINGIINELNDTIISGRIDRIFQPESDELHIIIRNKGANHRLLLSASANYPRIHITKHSKKNPATPPVFCMVLRKHLIGGRLISLHQPSFDRIVELTFEVITEMGDLVERRLIIEIMGRHSNIILINEAGYILDSIKHIGGNISRVREVLPRLPYVYPPSRGKLDPIKCENDMFLNILKAKPELKPAKAIMNTFNGISKVTAEEIVYKALGMFEGKLSYNDLLLLVNSFYGFLSRIKNNNYRPTMILDQESIPLDILPYKYKLYEKSKVRKYESFSELLEDFYFARDKFLRLSQLSSNLIKLIRTNLERSEKKHATYLKELESAKSGDKYRLYGELVTANIHSISSGMESISVINYYDPSNEMIDIPLDPAKSPAQNAQKYFKLASKANTVISKMGKLIKETEDETIYLESLTEALSRVSSDTEINEIRKELVEQGYIRKTKKNKSKDIGENKPLHYLSSDGFQIFVGKNNIQNDLLTLKKASNNDIWLHTKNMPGSHVIIKSKG
ncbi:MAG TPA: NFACT RNA binding domain-containing protein, partial [Bacillota bacterium]|nr:NFACT RNA binding domain-containing protein [Bacillota bacterium]